MDNGKKILYIVRYPLNENFNLKGKFDGQLAAFRNLNMDVYYLGFDEKHFYLIHNEEKEIVSPTTSWVPMYFHTKVYYDMHQAVKKVLKKIRFDYAYWREAPIWRSSYVVGKLLHEAGTKILYEIPTCCKKAEEAASLPRRLFSVYANLWRKKLMQYPDVFVCIGDVDFDRYYGKPAVRINNGICLDSVPIRKPEKNKDAIHILALASMSYWHGYDRLIRSAAQYSGSVPVVIHMVGGNDGGMLPQWEKLTEELHAENKVIFHGKMYGDELTHMFDLCDVGINSLGLYRKDLEATSELKVREYTARGLPFVCTVDDPALRFADKPFWIKLANDDSVPDMKEIVDFALAMRQEPEHPANMRAYAQKHMSWEAQYGQVFKRLSTT